MPGPSNPPLIRQARADDAAPIAAIARAAYAEYIARIGREPAPMRADFAAAIAAGRVVVIETAGVVAGYMIAWPRPRCLSGPTTLRSIRRDRAKVSGDG